MSQTRAIRRLAIVTALTLAIFACVVFAGQPPYNPDIHPGDFVSSITNPYLPMPVGRHWTYKSTDGVERVEVEVTGDVKSILGVFTTVVRDRVYTNGVLSEDTFDWYAQHKDGTVWYFGEDTKTLDAQGHTLSTEGSWEGGVAGALPGIIMRGQPEVGDPYRQEFSAGVAEDFARVVSLNASAFVPFGAYGNCVETAEWSPLATGPKEHKFYAYGVGQVLELDRKERLELTDFKP